MKNWLWVWLFFLSMRTVFACSVVDDAGNHIHLDKPAQRIISLAPDLTELLFTAGAGNKIVGVMHGSDYPLRAKAITEVASYNQVDAEKIISLHPDLIVAWAEGGIANQVGKLGIPVYLSRQHKLTDIPITLKRLGCLAGTKKIADKAAVNFMQRYAFLKKRYSQQKNIKVFYQVWPEPLITITKNSWINDAITLCGGENIFADLLGAAPEVDIEAVINANPDVIIAGSTQVDWQKQWQHWTGVNAVKYQHLFSINSDWVERASIRILDGAEQICQMLKSSKEGKKND